MLDTIKSAIESKGFLIGLFMGLLKTFQDIRAEYSNNPKFSIKDVKWFIVFTDLFASTFVGYTVYEWSSESDILSSLQVTGLTIFLSINSFIVIKVITDPKLVKKLIGGWIKSKTEIKEEK